MLKFSTLGLFTAGFTACGGDDGLNGTPGTDGADGMNGANGDSGRDGSSGVDAEPPGASTAMSLDFEAIPPDSEDNINVPVGYTATVLYAAGDPLSADLADYAGDGSEPGSEFDRRCGECHDGMWFFGLADDGTFDPSRSDRALLCLNHEYVPDPGHALHVNGVTTDGGGVRTVADEVRKEIKSHGVSIIEVVRDSEGRWSYVQDSPFNRRITGDSPIEIYGPLSTYAGLVTKHSPTPVNGHHQARGTLNNCANGYTAWGTYLTCEENWHGYFKDDNAMGQGLARADAIGSEKFLAGIGSVDRYRWSDLAGVDEVLDDEFRRFDTTPVVGLDADEDYRNEPNQYGYVVEIDPFDPQSTPRKRTALGKFRHEGSWPGRFVEGEPVVFYSGDDDQMSYIYKFVSAEVYDPADVGLAAGDKYLDSGTLYAARFEFDAFTGARVGRWVPLEPSNSDIAAINAIDPVAEPDNPARVLAGKLGTLEDILLNTRGAAWAAGATPMDRPEWSTTNRHNGDVYFTLTNNSDRRNFNELDPDAVAAALADPNFNGGDEITEFLSGREFGRAPWSPRVTRPDGSVGGNEDGHIIRMREFGQKNDALDFAWEIVLYGSDPEKNRNLSGLDEATNLFTDPDGVWFDDGGLLWVQTDGGQPVGNNQMLVALPGDFGDPIRPENAGERLKRVMTGPIDCEVTGIAMTPDRRSVFINIQHPGDDLAVEGGVVSTSSSWPRPRGSDATQIDPVDTRRSRSATIVIQRADGGVLAADVDPMAN
ncbi:MAG: alkaline phosphatase PhoX [Myxococcota bacterium]